VDDWRVLYWGAYAFFRLRSFAEGSRVVSAIAEVASALDHFPDVVLRPHGVTIRTFTCRDGALGPVDVDFAQQVSAAAAEVGLEADPSQVQTVGIAVAQDNGVDVRPFWAAAFGYEDLGEEDAIDPHRRNPHLWFHRVEPPRPGRGRVHIDVSVPADLAVTWRGAGAHLGPPSEAPLRPGDGMEGGGCAPWTPLGGSASDLARLRCRVPSPCRPVGCLPRSRAGGGAVGTRAERVRGRLNRLAGTSRWWRRPAPPPAPPWPWSP
jgi:pterin-4a-carbinolamine dehydratase